MDARSVISCVRYQWNRRKPGASEAMEQSAGTASEASLGKILSWFTRLRADHPRRNMVIGLDEMEEWKIWKGAVGRPDGQFFSVVGVEVEIKHREVPGWSQPLLKHHGRGLNGMICQSVNGALRFLVRG